MIAHLLDSVPSNVDWQERTAALLRAFPETTVVDVRSTGTDPEWLAEPLWHPRHGEREG